MSYGVHKVSPVHGTMCEEVFVTLQKGQEKVKVKTTGLVHNFIIPANFWNHDWRSKWNGLMSYGVHKKCFGRTDAQTKSRYYQVPNGVRRGDNISAKHMH